MPHRPGFPILTLAEGKKIYASIKKRLPCMSYVAGSIRRGNLYINDIDIVIIPGTRDIGPVIESIMYKIERYGSKLINGIYYYGEKKVLIDFFITTHKELPYAMLQYTGPKTYNIRIRKYVKDHGYLLNQYGLFYANKPSVRVSGTANLKTERDVIRFIGTTYYHPADRE